MILDADSICTREFTKEEFTKLKDAITKKTTRKDIEKILQKYRNRIINILVDNFISFIINFNNTIMRIFPIFFHSCF